MGSPYKEPLTVAARYQSFSIPSLRSGRALRGGCRRRVAGHSPTLANYLPALPEGAAHRRCDVSPVSDGAYADSIDFYAISIGSAHVCGRSREGAALPSNPAQK